MPATAYRRTQPIGIYLLLLAATIGAYFLYGSFVVPVVEVTATVKRSASVDYSEYTAIPEDKGHHPWFRDSDWERGRCSILHTARGKILFEDFEREDEKTWLVFPFSMVMDREKDADNRELPPLILRCAKGARLHFDQPVSANSGSSSFRLVNAQLEGAVEVFRKSASGGSDELRVETSNVFVDNDQILTIEDVAFWFGNNQGIGRNMSIQLSRNGAGNQLAKDLSSINGITSIRLGFLSSMRLMPSQRTEATNDKAGAERMLSTDRAPIEITSAGPFQFDFDTNLAQFQERVRVRKLDEFGDTLDCHRLVLQFDSSDQTKVVALDSARNDEFQLQSIIAEGSPVVLNAKSQNATVKGQVLQYSLAQQRINVSDPVQVHIAKDDSQFVAKSIEYQLTEDGRLGTLLASGPGQLVRIDDNSAFRASWDQQLQLVRENNQQQLIQLAGNVKVKLDGDSELAGDSVDLLIWEVPVFDEQQKFAHWSYQPARLDALRNVRVTSDKLIADAESLRADWPNNPQAAKQQGQQGQLGLPGQRVGQLHQPVVRTVGYANSESAANARNHSPNGLRHVVRKALAMQIAKAEQPLIAKSKSIAIRLDDDNGTSNILDLQLLGSVVVRRASVKQPGTNEFEILGDELTLIPQAEQQFQIQLASKDELGASIVTDEIKLAGDRMFLDQEQNRMWVKGAGRVTMANETVATDEMDVEFAGGMIFDGQKIYFERDVRANVVQLNGQEKTRTKAVGEALSITLDRGFRFRELEKGASGQNPGIVQMIFRESVPPEKTQFKLASFTEARPPRPVRIASIKKDANGNVVEKLTLRCPNASVSKNKNQMIANGPGSIEIYRKGGKGGSASGFGFVRGASGENSQQFTYIHTNFARQLVANTETNEMTMTGALRSVYAPVQDLKQTYNPDQPTQLPTGAIRLNCDRIDVVKTHQFADAGSRFVASGNAHINSSTLDAKSDRLSYRDDTDELTLESTTDRDVALKMRRDLRSHWYEMSGAELTYWPKTKTAEVKRAGRISGTLKNGQ